MIVKLILDEQYLTLPEVKEILADVSKQKSGEELQYELKRALDHVNTFAKLDVAESRALVNELIDLKKMKEEIAIRIADIARFLKMSYGLSTLKKDLRSLRMNLKKYLTL